MSFLSNHRRLAKGNANFIELMLEQPHLVAGQRQVIRSGEIPAAYEILRNSVSPWPVIIGSKYKNEMAEVCEKIGNLLYKSIVLLARDFPALFPQQDDLPVEWFNELNADDDVGKYMIGRYDALVSHGALKLVEYNAGTNIGGWHLYRLMGLYRNIIKSAEELEDTPILEVFLASIEQMIKQKIAGKNRPYNVLFVLENEHEKDEFVSSMPYFEEAICKRKLNLRLLFDVNFQKIEVDEHGAWLAGQQIDALSVPIFEVDFTSKKLQKLTQLHWQNKVVFPDNPVYLATGNKSCFAGLYFLMQQNLLTKEEAALVCKYIPWTQYLGDELQSLTGLGSTLDFDRLVQEKDLYVIKRDGLLAGQHVYVGKFMSVHAWENILSLTRKGTGWILQKYYPSDGFYAPSNEDDIVQHDYIFGFFDFGSQYGGCGVRLMQSKSSDGVVNSAKGAHYTAVFEVKSKSLVI